MPGKVKKSTKRRSLGKADRVYELVLPSVDDDGEPNTCTARRPGPQGLIKNGILDSLDSLSGIAGDSLLGDAESMKSTAESLRSNPKKLVEMLDVIDKVTVLCVCDPKVSLPPEAGEERDPEVLYVDDVDLDDKMFIMQWAMGGTSDLETFRKETQQLVGNVETITGVPVPSK